MLRLLALSLSLFSYAPSLQAAPDLVIVNARVFTADPANPWAQAVAIENGRVSLVGDSGRARSAAGPATRVVDAGGRLVVPGLTEAHVHFSWRLPSSPVPMPDMPFPGPTPDQALAAVANAARSGSGWISASIGPLVINEERNWRRALDAAAPDRPVILRVTWGHGTLLNTAALRALKLGDSEPDPVGGRFGRDAAGRLDGLVLEAAETVVQYRLARAHPSHMAATARMAADRYLRWGVTSVHLMNSGSPLDQTLEMLAGADSPIRWSVYAWGYPAKSMRVPGLEAARASSARGNVRVAGVKWMLDGTPIERGARLRAPYADKPGWRGVSNFTDAELREILLDALARTNQTALHVVGNAEIERLFAAMEALAPTERWQSRRLRIEHGEGLEPDLIPRAEKLGVIVVQNPLHLEPLPAEAGREMMESRMGRQRMATNQPLRSLLAAGVPLALGSDAGGDAASPYLNMMLATQHRLNPKEALTREQALLAYTSGGAMAEGQESIRGMIKAGMTADMAMLSQDVLTAPLERLPATVSLLTVIGGRVVHEARQSEPEGKADRTMRP